VMGSVKEGGGGVKEGGGGVTKGGGGMKKGGGGMKKNTPPPLVGGGWGEGSTQKILKYAREMRHAPTPAERRLWQGLRNYRAAGLKFRRQMPLGPYIVDFYCSTARLVVEVDGISHIDSPTDAKRDAWMEQQGIRIHRLTNYDVLSNLEGVLLGIGQIAQATPPPSLGPLRGPSPQGEGKC
jgi:very-short-patch-repair endonuclease